MKASCDEICDGCYCWTINPFDHCILAQGYCVNGGYVPAGVIVVDDGEG